MASAQVKKWHGLVETHCSASDERPCTPVWGWELLMASAQVKKWPYRTVCPVWGLVWVKDAACDVLRERERETALWEQVLHFVFQHI